MQEDRIGIHVDLRNGHIDSVQILSRRNLQACRLFVGRDAAAVDALIPLIYHVCARAHQLASGLALARAAGEAPVIDAGMVLPMLLESCQEHARRILLDWPRFCGEAPAAAAVGRVRDLMFRIGEAADSGSRLPALLDELQRTLCLELVGSEEFAGDHEAFVRWAHGGSGAAAALPARVLREGLADYGASDIPVMTLANMGSADIEELLARDEDGGFVRAPHYGQGVHETGPLARQGEQALLADLCRHYGNGLLSRLAAGLLECLRLPAQMRELLAGHALSDHVRIDDSGPAGSGLVMVEAARGCLCHRVEMTDGRVSRYQILAPTEWNFHPRGALVKGLNGRHENGGREALLDKLQLMSTALDPCVACDIEVSAHA